MKMPTIMDLQTELIVDERFERHRIITSRIIYIKKIKPVFRSNLDVDNFNSLFELADLTRDENSNRNFIEFTRASWFRAFMHRFASKMYRLHINATVCLDNLADVEEKFRNVTKRSEHYRRQNLYDYYLINISLLKFSSHKTGKECIICCRTQRNFANFMCCKQIDLYCTYCIGIFKKCPICKRSYYKETELIEQSKKKCTNPYAFTRAHYAAYKMQQLQNEQ